MRIPASFIVPRLRLNRRGMLGGRKEDLDWKAKGEKEGRKRQAWPGLVKYPTHRSFGYEAPAKRQCPRGKGRGLATDFTLGEL